MKLVQLIVVLFFAYSTGYTTETKNFGQELTLKETTPISEILKAPKDFMEKTVLVKGRVLDVCQKRGCWMKIASDSEFESILIKVDDGVIVFPMEAKGKMALVEGTMEEVEFTMEQTIERQKHECEKEGKEFDAAKVSKPDVMYRLRASGAEIEM